MLRTVLLAVIIGVLFILNPSMESFLKYAKSVVEEDQSTIRAGWSAVSRATGIDYLSKKAGVGNYEICRRNLYLVSLFTVRNSKLTDSTTPVAIAFGAGGFFYHKMIPSNKEQWGVITKLLAEQFEEIATQECRDVHNSGEATLG